MRSNTEEWPISYEAAEPSTDHSADMCFTQLYAEAILWELWATFGGQERLLCESVTRLIELIDETQKSSAGVYTVGKSLGYNLADPTELAICRAAELYFDQFIE